MENRNLRTPSAGRQSSSAKPKFREITVNGRQFNELNSKYELYKRGSPNIYGQDMEQLKARSLRQEVQTLQLPAVDYIISQMSGAERDKQVNQRDYELYPTLLRSGSTRYKEMLSEKQQIRDFILWFEGQFEAIEKGNAGATKKFQDKQTLIAAGFTEMTAQVAKVSKNRAEILKMLWNRQTQEVSCIVESLNTQGIRKQKALLEQISSLHRQYQLEIETLRSSVTHLEEGGRKQKDFSRSCVGSLRGLRKKIKKLEYMVKKLGESNVNLKKQNLNLMEENIKLLMNIREVTQEEAILLNYRKLQIYQQKDKLKRQKTKHLLQLAQQESLTPIQDLQQKKDSLYQYFLERIRENPHEKALLKEEYFSDEEDVHSTIEQYFKTIVNKPNLQVELLNEVKPQAHSRERAVNTDPPVTQYQIKISPLYLDKGTQVQLMTENNGMAKQFERDGQRRIYQVMSQKEEEQLDRESKKRIIKHRMSRKNSLTLLQLQSINQLQNKSGRIERKTNQLSAFAKRDHLSGSNNSLSHQEEEISHVSSDDSDLLIADQLKKDNPLCQLTLNPIPLIGCQSRKSHNFRNLLQRISEDQQSDSSGMKGKGIQGIINNLLPKREHSVKKQYRTNESADNKSNQLKGSESGIKMEGQQQQNLREIQLQDLIKKHLEKREQGKALQNPQKSLNKALLGVFRSASSKRGVSFMLELLQVIKTSYGNTKSVIWKFLWIVGAIRDHQNSNSLLKIVSLLLRINDKFKPYEEVNQQEICELYFRLFTLLSIRSVGQNSFNLWKTCTTLDKVKSLEFLVLLEDYFSHKKRAYIENKIEQFVALARPTSTDQQERIVKLNPILLYVLEVYLIEKQLYHSSYSEMLDFLCEDGYIPTDLLLWFVDLLGLPEEKQREVITFALAMRSNRESRYCKSGVFLRCCVKFDFPLLEQLSVCTYAQFKLLPVDVQQNYFRMIGLEEWADIRTNLVGNYQRLCDSPLYLRAFQLVIDKLEHQIRRGASIYGQYAGHDRLKRKEQVFSLFYKIIILQAHKNHIPNSVQ